MRTGDRGYGQDYWQSLDGGNGYRDSVLWEDLAHIVVEELVTSGARVFDIGCAAGFLVQHLRRRGVEAFGVDLSEYALSLASPGMAGYLNKLDLTVEGSMWLAPGMPAQVVICLETLEHIPEDRLEFALENIRVAMTDTGRALLSICLDDVPGWDEDPTHVTIHDRRWWLARLAEANLHVATGAESAFRRYRMFKPHNGLFLVTR